MSIYTYRVIAQPRIGKDMRSKWAKFWAPRAHEWQWSLSVRYLEDGDWFEEKTGWAATPAEAHQKALSLTDHWGRQPNSSKVQRTELICAFDIDHGTSPPKRISHETTELL